MFSIVLLFRKINSDDKMVDWLVKKERGEKGQKKEENEKNGATTIAAGNDGWFRTVRINP